MKKIALVCICISLSNFLFSNNSNRDSLSVIPMRKDYLSDTADSIQIPKFYLSLGTGSNSVHGIIGIGFSVRVDKRILLFLDAGTSSWGRRVSFGIQSHKPERSSLHFGASYSYNTGYSDFDTEMEIYNGKTTIDSTVTFDLMPAGTINVQVGYQFKFKKKGHRFFLEAGYAVPLTKSPYKVKNNVVLTDVSKMVIEIMSPGGFMLGLGFMIGI